MSNVPKLLLNKKKASTAKKGKKKAPSKEGAKKQSQKENGSSPDLLKLAYPDHLNENKVIEDLRETVEKLKIFDEIGKTLTSSLDLIEIVRTVVERFGKLVDCRHFGLLLIDESGDEFYYQYPESLNRTKTSFPLGQGILGQILENGEGGIWRQVSERKAFCSEVDGAVIQKPKNIMALPIHSKGRVLGLLAFFQEEAEKDFANENFELLRTFSDYLAIAIENARHHQRIQALTVTDDLTQLYNSRYLHLVLERELSRSRRHQENLSVVFIDLDNFKQVNDQYGHLAGSNLLGEFGEFLGRHIRASDIGVRYGGDEFVLVLPKTNKTEAIRVVQRMIEDLRDHSFLDSNLSLTASFGIASFPEDAKDIDKLIAAADHAMYAVKRKAKDGFQVATADESLRGDPSA